MSSNNSATNNSREKKANGNFRKRSRKADRADEARAVASGAVADELRGTAARPAAVRHNRRVITTKSADGLKNGAARPPASGARLGAVKKPACCGSIFLAIQ